MTMDTRTFNIPAANKALVEEQIEKLNRRAAKLNLSPITLSWQKAFLQDEELVIPCELTGPFTVSYDGWDFIATLQHLPTGENIIRAISDDYAIPTEYQTSGSACQHCKVNRYRKDTYVVRHNNGDYRQVGSTCIKDFLGGNSPDNIMQRASLAGEIISFMRGAGVSQGGHDEGIFHITNFLAQTVACIRDHGWVSKSKAYETGQVATSSWVADDLMVHPAARLSKVSEADKQKAKEAAEWAESLSDEETELSDYLHNIRAIARSGMVGHRTMGYAASIISSFERATVKMVPATLSSHVGVLKKRENFELILKKTFAGHSVYGEFLRMIFTDDKGNIVTWISSDLDLGLEEGKRYCIRGTVKAHTEYKGVKQTEINRCEVMTYYE